MDKSISQPQSSVPAINLNMAVLETMAKGPEKDRIVCPVCGQPKQTGHLVCQECNRVSGAFQAVKAAVYKLRGQSLPAASSRTRPAAGPVVVTRNLKVEMVRYAIEAIGCNLDLGALPEVMAKNVPAFSRVSIDDRRRAVRDANDAVSAARAIEAHAQEKGISLEDTKVLADSFIQTQANGRLTEFVVKAAVYCIILPRHQKREAFEEQVAAALRELEAMGLSSAYNTTPVQIRDSLIEASGQSNVSRGFRDFCFKAGEEALKRFKASHTSEWTKHLENQARIAKEHLQRRFEGRGYRVNKARVA